MEGGRSHMMFQNPWLRCADHMKNDDRSASSSTSSIGEVSKDSYGGSSTSDASDTADDASSSASSSNSGRISYDLTEIMAQLPIRRGLSKFYQGKSESFTSLSRATSIEDLAKKTPPHRRRTNLKACCRSYGADLNSSSSSYRLHTLPKPVIWKKAIRGSYNFSSFSSKTGSFMSSTKQPQPTPPLQEELEC